jgi:hypothetical protein
MADAPTIEQATPSGLEALDSAIASFEASIPELQRNGTPESSPTPGDPSKSGTEQPAPTEQPAAEPAQEPGGTASDDESESGTEPAAPTSRMGRLRQQLTAAEERSRQLETQFQELTAQQQVALRQFVDLVLPDATYRQLELQARGGDWEAKQRLDQADAWRKMVSPIANLAHEAARKQAETDVQALRTAEGMDGDMHQKLASAPTAGEQVKLAWQLGRKSASEESRDRIAALEAEIQTLKTNRAASGAQPANGGAPAQGGSGLAGLLGRDGQLTDEAMNLSPAQIRARFGNAA